MNPLRLSFLVAILMCLAAHARAQIIDVNFSGGGTTNYSGWSNLGVSYAGYGGAFPGRSSWPTPIPATAGSTNATLNRTLAVTNVNFPQPGTNTISGPYVTGNTITDTNGSIISTGSVYFGSLSGSSNVFGGTVRVAQAGPLNGLQTIVFQIQIGEVFGYDFFEPSGFPSLTLDGSSSVVPASFTNLVNRFENGLDPQLRTPLFINTWGYQWNLTNGQMPSSYAITMSGVAHSQIYGLRLDETTVLQSTAVVPEPTVTHLLAITGLLCMAIIAHKIRKARS